MLRFCEQVEAYRACELPPKRVHPKAVAKQGSSRLRYRPARGERRGAPLLFIPSLINPYYVLDLTKKHSMLCYFAAAGYPSYIVDWGIPGAAENDFDAGDYITRYLTAYARHITEAHGEPPVIIGHCMGGMLALALAALEPDCAKKLVLLAPPWDFSRLAFPGLHPSRFNGAALEALIQGRPYFSGEQVLALFFLRNPLLFYKKMERFEGIRRDTAALAHFLAIESWAGDAIPLTQGVARDCFIRWGQENTALRGRWQVGGEAIHPAMIAQQSFLVMPTHDRIVPAESSRPLAAALRRCDVLEPESGHIGMVAGTHAETTLWRKLLGWLGNGRGEI